MEERYVTQALLSQFGKHLRETEKSEATIEKYMRDMRRFAAYAQGKQVTRPLITAYKEQLIRDYAAVSANSMLASFNAFLRFCGWPELCVRQFRLQRKAYTPEEKELSQDEYLQLVKTAKKRGNRRLSCILQAIGSTGMRVSELKFITVEALERGEATVQCKGKIRAVFLVQSLRKLLLRYAREQGITSGPVFVTATGRPVSRTAVWRDMKSLCREAGVPPGKVFPHNLRHLFARTFYGLEKDIAKLADILGHTSINTTRIYIASTGAEHRQKLENMRMVLQI